MDATKALAQRLRRRNSKWRERRTSAPRSPTSNPLATVTAKIAGSLPASPASSPTPTPTALATTAPETEKIGPTAAPQRANFVTPSPGSGVSPRSQAPPKQEEIDKNDTLRDAEDATAETTTSYFDLKNDVPTKDMPASRITFSIPTKEGKEDGNDSYAERDSREFDTAISSAVPSTVASPRTSQDEEEDMGQSSAVSVSLSGGGSRHSSIASVAFRLPDESLPQGRARRHRNSLPPSSR